ncbi:MAG: ABC transporter permease, partial [Pseudomonadota bacterium]
MRNTWLVFVRDYLGYVKAWGFWLGVAATPLIILVFVGIMILNETNQPIRYYTIVEQDGLYQSALQNEFDDRARRAARLTLEAQERLTGVDGEMTQRFDAAIANGATVDAAMEEAGAGETFASPTGDYIFVPAPAETPDALRPWLLGEQLIDGPEGEKPLFAAIFPGPDGIEYWSENVTVAELRLELKRASEKVARRQVFEGENVDLDILKRAEDAAPDILQKRARPEAEQATEGDAVTIADRAPFFAAVGIAYVLWLMIFSVIQYLLMGTIEERSNKIFDTLLTSVRLPQLLTGKLAAVFAVTMTLMGSWAIAGTLIFGGVGAALPASVTNDLNTALSAILDPKLILPALISFFIGYVMYGAVFMAMGSLCDTIQEAQTLLSPMMMLLILPGLMIGVAFSDVESPIVAAFSWVPIFTPFLLILRMPAEPPLWEVLLQIGLMTAVAMLIIWAATKVYRAGAVHGAG